jgi:peptidoglycan/LPS O-acetylase OafA/YrhL
MGVANRLEYLDGVRGFAALYVMLYHADRMIGLPSFLSPLLSLGRFSVTVFIVLSGYCLALPVVRKTSLELGGGFSGYISRRARRILPPYYAALVGSLLVSALLPKLHEVDGLPNPDFHLGPLVSHLFLVHNVTVPWAHSINSVLWSVATEWQIYFLFAFLLLPVWRRFGLGASVVVGFVVGLFPFFAFGSSDLFSPWYLGIFALGQAGAAFTRSPDPRLIALRSRVPWRLLALIGLSMFLAASLGIRLLGWEELMRRHFRWVLDTILGLAAAAFLVDTSLGIDAGRPSRLAVGIFEARLGVFLGAISYSLYVTHAIVLELFKAGQSALGLTGHTATSLVATSAMLAAVVVAYVFHLFFERPFQRPAAAPVAAPAVVSVDGVK